MLVQRLRRWTNIEPASGVTVLCIVLIGEALNHGWFNVGPLPDNTLLTSLPVHAHSTLSLGGHHLISGGGGAVAGVFLK